MKCAFACATAIKWIKQWTYIQHSVRFCARRWLIPTAEQNVLNNLCEDCPSIRECTTHSHPTSKQFTPPKLAVIHVRSLTLMHAVRSSVVCEKVVHSNIKNYVKYIIQSLHIFCRTVKTPFNNLQSCGAYNLHKCYRWCSSRIAHAQNLAYRAVNAAKGLVHSFANGDGSVCTRVHCTCSDRVVSL